jgi:hypothetical protein
MGAHSLERTTGTSVISTLRSRRVTLGKLSIALPLLAVALVLSSCISSGYTYFSHTNPDHTVVYFKLPSNWVRYTFSSDVKAANGQLSPSQVSQIQGARWYMSFAGSRTAKPNLFSDLAAKYPQGIAFVAQLSENARDSFSLAQMRSEILGEDPLAQANNSPFNVLSYNEFTLNGGIRGSKLVTDIADRGGLTDTYAQVVEVDPGTNYVFALAIACRASCWGPNQGTINQILNTWSVKELGHG